MKSTLTNQCRKERKKQEEVKREEGIVSSLVDLSLGM